MAKFDDKVNGNTVDGDEYNNIVRAPKDVIETSGQSIDASNTQLTKGVAGYVASGNFYTDSGSANAYILNNIGSFRAPNAYTDGMEVRFRAGNASTTASTVNVSSLGVKNIKKPDGTTDISTDIVTDVDTVLRFDLSNDVFIIQTALSDASETVKGIIEIATQAETDAGTDDLRAITPAKILGLFNTSSQAADGYIRIPANIAGAFSEIIIQWGDTGSIGPASSLAVSFPISFPNSAFNVQASIKDTPSPANGARSPYIINLTTSGFTMRNQDGDSSYSTYWVAIGY
jgi:hypothetical protein